MKTLSLTLLLSLLVLPVASADIVYSENFDSQDGKGAVGPGPTVDLAGVDWTIDVSATVLTANAGHFQVKNSILGGSGNKALEAFDVDGPAIWNSPVIDISGFTDLSFSLDAIELGFLETADYFDVSYSVDGTAATKIIDFQSKGNAAHTLVGNFGSADVTQLLSNGSTLQIFATMLVDAVGTGSTNEYLQLDNVLVTGTVAAVPEPSAFLFGGLLAGVMGLSVARRRRV